MKLYITVEMPDNFYGLEAALKYIAEAVGTGEPSGTFRMAGSEIKFKSRESKA